MKKNFFLFLLAAGSYLHIAAQTLPKISVGDKITYGVDANGQSYDFIVAIKELSGGIKFNWTMSDPINKSGSISISESALKSARSYVNYFTSGDQVLDEASSVFLSDVNFKEIQKPKGTKMDMGEGNNGIWKGPYPDNFGFTYHGQDISPPAYYLGLEGNSDSYKEVVVLAQGKYHLILSMNLGWSIRIKSIE